MRITHSRGTPSETCELFEDKTIFAYNISDVIKILLYPIMDFFNDFSNVK